MATLEQIRIQSMLPDFSKISEGIYWNVNEAEKVHFKVPHIFFSDGTPWLEANAYSLSKLSSVFGSNPKTVLSNLNHIKAYADWLELHNLSWRHFPEKKSERCLFRYRGALIEARNKGAIYPSTATARMAAVLGFYRWIQDQGIMDGVPLWAEQIKSFTFYTSVGFQRTMQVASSELTIPNRKSNSFALEDGLLPINPSNKKALLNFLSDYGNIELYLMFKIAFFTGARSETIRTLRVRSIESALEDPLTPVIKRVTVGPGTQVKTKFDVKGNILFPTQLLEELESYAYSARRLARTSKVLKEDRDLLFISQQGNRYADSTFTKLISDLRVDLIKSGLTQFQDLKFHQARATFGTTLMQIALNELPNKADAILFVRDAMLHKHESTTWKYIKFIESSLVKEAVSDEFYNLFIGEHIRANDLIRKVTFIELA